MRSGEPTMRFVPVKSVQQRDLQHLHRIRSEAVAQRRALLNLIRGFLLEYGVVIAHGFGSRGANFPMISMFINKINGWQSSNKHSCSGNR